MPVVLLRKAMDRLWCWPQRKLKFQDIILTATQDRRHSLLLFEATRQVVALDLTVPWEVGREDANEKKGQIWEFGGWALVAVWFVCQSGLSPKCCWCWIILNTQLTQGHCKLKISWSIRKCITSKVKEQECDKGWQTICRKTQRKKERNHNNHALPWQCIVQKVERWGGSRILSLQAHSQPLGQRILHHTPQLAFSSLGGCHCAMRDTWEW